MLEWYIMRRMEAPQEKQKAPMRFPYLIDQGLHDMKSITGKQKNQSSSSTALGFVQRRKTPHQERMYSITTVGIENVTH